MKIVHVSTYMSGGAGVAAFRLHKALFERGIDSSFLVKSGSCNQNDNQHILKCPPYYPISYRIKKKLGISNDDLYFKNLNKKQLSYDIATLPVAPFRIEDQQIVKEADIIHLHWVSDFLNFPTFFKSVKQPIVWTLHDMNTFKGFFHYDGDYERNKNEFYKATDKKIRQLKNQSIHTKDNIFIVSPSKWLGNLSQNSDILHDYYHDVIPYNLDFNLFPSIDRQKAKEQLGINNGLKTLLFVANEINSYRKGFDLLIDAIRNLNRTDFNLISIGAGGNYFEINNKIKHIHIEQINSLSELNMLYSGADITILPSREDNLPNVMLESFANGTPVMSFSNGGMAEHIATGKNGILITEINSEILKSNIADFLDNKYTFDNQAVRQYAKNQFSESIQVEKYINLYKNILNQNIKS